MRWLFFFLILVFLPAAWGETQDYYVSDTTYSWEEIQDVFYLKVEFDIGNHGDTVARYVNYSVLIDGDGDEATTDDKVGPGDEAHVSYIRVSPLGEFELRVEIYPPDDADGELEENDFWAENVTFEEDSNQNVLPNVATTILGAIRSWQQSEEALRELKITMGTNAPTEDIQVADGIHDIFYPGDKGKPIKPHRWMDKDVAQARKAVLVGGGCANTMVQYYFPNDGLTCETWRLKPGQAIIKYASTDIGDVILIAGTHKEDTLKALAEFQNYYYSYKFMYHNQTIIE